MSRRRPLIGADPAPAETRAHALAGAAAEQHEIRRRQRLQPPADLGALEPPAWMTPATRPVCPHCRGAMTLRRGPSSSFLGCRRYPLCRGTRRIPAPTPAGDAPV